MALYYELPVYKDTYQLIMEVYAVTKEFPREYKYSLGQDMKHDAMELVRCIYKANRSIQKKELLEQYLEQFELLKLELRISHDLHILGTGIKSNYILLDPHVDCQSLVGCRAASRRDAISVTPYAVWGMRITHRYDGRSCPTLRYARIG